MYTLGKLALIFFIVELKTIVGEKIKFDRYKVGNITLDETSIGFKDFLFDSS